MKQQMTQVMAAGGTDKLWEMGGIVKLNTAKKAEKPTHAWPLQKSGNWMIFRSRFFRLAFVEAIYAHLLLWRLPSRRGGPWHSWLRLFSK
jgi:hypothetical protein